MTDLTERVQNSDVEREYAIPPTSGADMDIPLALPVTRGDFVTIEYPEDADCREAGTTERLVFLDHRRETVRFAERDYYEERLEEDGRKQATTLYSTTVEGVLSFNERVQRHASRVTVERGDGEVRIHAP